MELDICVSLAATEQLPIPEKGNHWFLESLHQLLPNQGRLSP